MSQLNPAPMTDYERYKDESYVEFSLVMNTPIPDYLNPEFHFGGILLNCIRKGPSFLDFLQSEKHIVSDGEHPFRIDVKLSKIEESVTEEMNPLLANLLHREYLEKAYLLDINHEIDIFGEEDSYEDVLLPIRFKLFLVHQGVIEYEKDFPLNAVAENIIEQQRLIGYLQSRSS